MDQLKKTIRPEFLNRVDDIIVFHPLGKEHIRAIVDIQLVRVHKMLAKRNITLDVTESVKDWLASRGYDPVYGARPLKRLIQKEIVNKLATELIKRDEDKPAEFEATLSKDGSHIEFAEVFENAEEWAAEQ